MLIHSPLRAATAQLYLYAKDVDMRRSFDGLLAIVQNEFARDILQGDTFLFLNKRRDRIKVLWWDGDGMAIFMKNQESEDTHFDSFTGVEIHHTFNGIIDETRSTRFRMSHSKWRNAMPAKPGRIAPPRA